MKLQRRALLLPLTVVLVGGALHLWADFQGAVSHALSQEKYDQIIDLDTKAKANSFLALNSAANLLPNLADTLAQGYMYYVSFETDNRQVYVVERGGRLSMYVGLLNSNMHELNWEDALRIPQRARVFPLTNPRNPPRSYVAQDDDHAYLVECTPGGKAELFRLDPLTGVLSNPNTGTAGRGEEARSDRSVQCR